jgi:hypothetical protein
MGCRDKISSDGIGPHSAKKSYPTLFLHRLLVSQTVTFVLKRIAERTWMMLWRKCKHQIALHLRIHGGAHKDYSFTWWWLSAPESILLDAVWFILQPIRFLFFVYHKHLPPAKDVHCSFNPLDQHMGRVEDSRDMHLMFWISINGDFVNTLHWQFDVITSGNDLSLKLSSAANFVICLWWHMKPQFKRTACTKFAGAKLDQCLWCRSWRVP